MIGISSYDRHHYSIWNEASEDNEESDTTKSGMKGKFKKSVLQTYQLGLKTDRNEIKKNTRLPIIL